MYLVRGWHLFRRKKSTIRHWKMFRFQRTLHWIFPFCAFNFSDDFRKRLCRFFSNIWRFDALFTWQIWLHCLAKEKLWEVSEIKHNNFKRTRNIAVYEVTAYQSTSCNIKWKQSQLLTWFQLKKSSRTLIAVNETKHKKKIINKRSYTILRMW